jgi:hypothetical protein
MGEFAQFLETQIVDVSDDPVGLWSDQAQAFAKANRATAADAIATPTRLVDLSLKFKIYETAESCEAVNLTSGETEFTFVSEHKAADGKPVNFPKLFSIVIPIFARSSVFYRIIARLRYRIANGKPVFWYELWRPDLTFETAFNEALKRSSSRRACRSTSDLRKPDPVITLPWPDSRLNPNAARRIHWRVQRQVARAPGRMRSSGQGLQGICTCNRPCAAGDHLSRPRQAPPRHGQCHCRDEAPARRPRRCHARR